MNLKPHRLAGATGKACLASCIAALAIFAQAAAPADQPRKGMVASVQPMATEAGLEAMLAGGNAVDAAVATALMLGVVDGANSGLGGGCFLVVRLADGRVVAVDGRETAPSAAARDMYVRNGTAVPALSQHGSLAVGVPGELAALDYVNRHFGKLPLRRHLEAAAKVAESGFTVTRSFAGRIAMAETDLRDVAPEPFAEFWKIFRNPEGENWKAGQSLRQTELAQTYRTIAREGTTAFYNGEFASRTEAWMKRNGGILTASDFAAYRPKIREPIRSTYRGHEIIGFPPPSSGGVHVAQILNILEHFDLKSLGNGTPAFIHTIAEAMKLAFADRAHWLGDPDFTRVPRGLASTNYADQLARRIHTDRVTTVAGHGQPPDASLDVFPRLPDAPAAAPDGKHTTHFSTADAEGNWVACTATINTTFGSKLVVPGTGVVLNNEMDDFSAQPGAPNAFGLVGAEANAVAPGKRPLSSMSPTIVLRDGRPILAVGAAGGPTIISQTVLAIVQAVDFGADPKAALSRPRFHQQWKPDELVIERAAGREVIAELERRGHRVKVVSELGATQAVGWQTEGAGGFTGAHDPRVEGASAGW